MRGKTVYYSSIENKTLYTISIDGKNKKKVASNIGTLIGSINSVGSYVAYGVENIKDFPITYSVKSLK